MKLGTTEWFDFTTHHPQTGLVTDADSTPTAEVFEEDTDAAIVTPAVTKRIGKTGNYRVGVAATSGNGFEAGKSYNLVVSATVNGVAQKAAIAQFRVDSAALSDLPLATDYTAARAVKIDNLDATVSSRSTLTAQAVWDALTSALTTVGSIGKKLADWVLGSDSRVVLSANAHTGAVVPTVTAVTNAVGVDMAQALPGTPAAGSTGEALKFADTRIDATTSSRALPGDAMTLTVTERNNTADALLDRANAIEVGLTLRQALRLAAAALAGKLSGAGGTTITIRNALADSKDRVIATVDSTGNRSALTLDVS